MTNTNDFRQYSYQYDTNALISSFNYTRGSHAPKVRPEPDYRQPERKLRVKDAKGIKSQPQLLHEQRVSRKKAIRITFAAVICLAMIGIVLNSFALKNQLTREIAKQETAIAEAENEYISLQSQLNVMYSVSMIDKYAAEKLKMSKVRQGQVQYIDVDSFKAAALKKKAKAEKAKNKKPKVSVAAAAMAAAKSKPEAKEKENLTEENKDSEASEDEAASTQSEDGEESEQTEEFEGDSESDEDSGINE